MIRQRGRHDAVCAHGIDVPAAGTQTVDEFRPGLCRLGHETPVLPVGFGKGLGKPSSIVSFRYQRDGAVDLGLDAGCRRRTDGGSTDACEAAANATPVCTSERGCHRIGRGECDPAVLFQPQQSIVERLAAVERGHHRNRRCHNHRSPAFA